MDFSNPDLILGRVHQGKVKAFLRASKVSSNLVELIDIEHEETFRFEMQMAIDLLDRGVLKEIPASTLPDTLLMPKKKVLKTDVDPKLQAEMERKYSYVKGAIRSDITGYTEMQLKPFIRMKAQEIGDQNPPAWITLTRWINVYRKSGSKKESLIPKHEKKGCRQPRVAPEVKEIRDRVVVEHSKKSPTKIHYQNAYRDFLAEIDKENEKRLDQGLERLEPCSYVSLRRQFP